jgi:hypothetical protein
MGIITTVAIIAVALLYPYRSDPKLSKLQFYWYQKYCDFILGALTFTLVVFITNNQLPPSAYTTTFATRPVSIRHNHPTADKILKSLELRDKKTLIRQEKEYLRTNLKNSLKFS